MFNTGFNGQPKQQSTNTRLATWSCDYSCLQVRLWDDNLSLTFNVCTGKNADGRNQYDFQNKVSTAITPERAFEIHSYLADIIGDMENHPADITPSSIGFDVGTKGNRLVFSCEVDDDGPAAYIRLHNVGADGKSNDVVTYKFKHYTYYKNYNPKTGASDEYRREDELAMFQLFLSQLVNVTKGKYRNHSERYNRATEAMFSSNSNQQGGGFSNSNSANNGSASNYTAPVQTLAAGDDYPF